MGTIAEFHLDDWFAEAQDYQLRMPATRFIHTVGTPEQFSCTAYAYLCVCGAGEGGGGGGLKDGGGAGLQSQSRIWPKARLTQTSCPWPSNVGARTRPVSVGPATVQPKQHRRSGVLEDVAT